MAEGAKTGLVRVRIPYKEMPYYAAVATVCGFLQYPDKYHLQPKPDTLRELCHSYAEEAGDRNIAFADITAFFSFQARLVAMNPMKSHIYCSLGTGAGDDSNSLRRKLRLSSEEKKNFDSVAGRKPGILILGAARWFTCELVQWLKEWAADPEERCSKPIDPEPQRLWRRPFRTEDEEHLMRHDFFSRIVPFDHTEKRLAELRFPPEKNPKLSKPEQEKLKQDPKLLKQAKEDWLRLRLTNLSLEYNHFGIAARDPNVVRRIFDSTYL
jgi:hypothetical protein